LRKKINKLKKPLILVTNDDGITSKGIATLVEIASEFGEVVVVAPDSPQSAKGHGITINDPLRLRKVSIFDGIEAFSCSGTPVDCVKLAQRVVLKNRKIDLCLSGINHGSNASINVIYSGTMSAAMEASMEGIDAIGFSLCDHLSDADFSATKFYAPKIIDWLLKNPKPGGCHLFNVNFPKKTKSEIKGFRLARQSEGRWREDFLEGKTPSGEPYYWLTGKFICDDQGEGTDEWALANGYISVVPVQHDLTNYAAIANLKSLTI
jgi:5'-nucleotidase